MAAHDGRLAAKVRQTMTTSRDHWVTYVRRLAETGRLPADIDADAAGRVLFGLFPGFILQLLLLGDAEPEEFAAGVRALFPATAFTGVPATAVTTATTA
jgi:hypothetical protein